MAKLPVPAGVQNGLLVLFSLCIIAGALTIRAFPIVLGIGVIVLALAVRPGLPDIWRHHKNLIMALCAVVLMAGFSAAWSFDAGDTLERSAKLLLYFIPGVVLMALVRIIGVNAVSPFAVLLPASIIGGSLFIMVEVMLDMPVFRAFNNLDAQAFPPGYYNRNYYNKELAFLAFVAVPVLAMTWRARRYAWAAGMTAVLGVCLFMMANQTMQVAVPLMVVFWGLYKLTSGRIWWCVAPLLLAGVLAAPLLGPALFDMLSSYMDHAWLREASAAMRLEIWGFVSRAVAEKPVAGYGMEAARFMTFDTQALYYPGNTIMHPHNAALQIWLEFGALGAGVAAVLLALLVRGVAGSALRSTLSIGIIAAALMAWGMWQSWWIVLILFLYALAQGYDQGHDEAAARNPSSERTQSAI